MISGNFGHNCWLQFHPSWTITFSLVRTTTCHFKAQMRRNNRTTSKQGPKKWKEVFWWNEAVSYTATVGQNKSEIILSALLTHPSENCKLNAVHKGNNYGPYSLVPLSCENRHPPNIQIWHEILLSQVFREEFEHSCHRLWACWNYVHKWHAVLKQLNSLRFID